MKSTLFIFYIFVHKTNGLASTVKSFITEDENETKKSSNAASTYVINHEFCKSCLSEEDRGVKKKTLADVHTYAQLTDDNRASLPASFTIFLL